MTAEQAAEAAKGLTFEKVWAALMESRQLIEETQKQMKESQQETRKQMQETQKQMQESHQRTEKVMQESHQRTEKVMHESQRRTDKVIADLSKNIGGLGNSLGSFTEAMFGVELWRKFNELGFPFTKQSPHVKLFEYGKALAEIDFFLENGAYAMAVEIKTELSIGDIDEHLERIGKIRQYMDSHMDMRKLVGAVAGGIVSENVLKYAQKKGFFVIVQTGDSVAIADIPQGFKAKEW